MVPYASSNIKTTPAYRTHVQRNLSGSNLPSRFVNQGNELAFTVAGALEGLERLRPSDRADACGNHLAPRLAPQNTSSCLATNRTSTPVLLLSFNRTYLPKTMKLKPSESRQKSLNEGATCTIVVYVQYSAYELTQIRKDNSEYRV